MLRLILNNQDISKYDYLLIHFSFFFDDRFSLCFIVRIVINTSEMVRVTVEETTKPTAVTVGSGSVIHRRQSYNIILVNRDVMSYLQSRLQSSVGTSTAAAALKALDILLLMACRDHSLPC